MLKITPEPTFEADVEITVPGQEETGTIPLTFKYMDRDEYLAWLEPDVKPAKKGKAKKKAKTVAESFPEFVLGWGLDEEFTPEKIEIFLRSYPVAYREIFEYHSTSLLGSRVKN